MHLKHVRAGYRHGLKTATPGRMLDFTSACLKWYCLARPETPVEPAIETLALDFMRRASERPEWPLDAEVGFAILHRCEAGFYFLILCSWRNENELWETVYFKPDSKTLDFGLFPQSAHKGTYCVWEAGIVAHEVSAWSAFLQSNRDGAAMTRYLSSHMSGDVG